jgi:hypothetical protein
MDGIVQICHLPGLMLLEGGGCDHRAICTFTFNRRTLV